MSLKLPDRPVEPPPGLLIADTQWGVRYFGQTTVVDDGHIRGAVGVRECGDRPTALAWLAALLGCGNSDAELVAKVAGDPKAVWIRVDGAA